MHRKMDKAHKITQPASDTKLYLIDNAKKTMIL